MQSKKAKRFLIFGIVFCALTVIFALLYDFDIIPTMSTYLCATYVLYFIALAIFYNGAYSNEKGSKSTKVISYIFGLIALALSITLLVYGFVTGEITLFN